MKNIGEKQGIYLVLDVGGTQIKAGLLDESGSRIGEISSYPSRSRENADIILDNFAFILKELLRKNTVSSIKGVGMAFPGPFDYDKGICLIQGLNKYDSIYGKSLELEMKKRVPEIQDTKFSFLHDIESFALGEAWFGEVQDEKKVMCLCIGTGTGSAFLDNKIPQKSGSGVPDDGLFYYFPYKESIIDDYVSARGLEKISKSIFGEGKTGKELYDMSQQKEEKALTVWKLFGEDLKAAVFPVVEKFAPNAIVFGGQISKSFMYFGEDFAQECKKKNIKIFVQTETSEKAMQGLFIKMTKDEEC